MNEIFDLFEEFDTDTIIVTDFGIQYRGSLVDCIVKMPDGNIGIFGGYPDDEDSDVEEFCPTKEERRLIYEQILENM